jgi:hypothetical protein
MREGVMKKPLSVRAMMIITWLRIGLAIGFIVLINYLMRARLQDSFLRGVRQGLFSRAGLPDPATHTYREEAMWYITGVLLVALVLPGLLLLFIKWRKLLAVRIVAVLDVLAALSSGGLSFLLPAVILILAFRGSVKQYCRGLPHIAEGALEIPGSRYTGL